MIYSDQNCWPDAIDLRQVMRKFPSMERVNYQDLRAAFEWLRLAFSCYRQGKNRPVPLTEVKKLAEDFMGRKLGEDAFLVAVYLVTNCEDLTDEDLAFKQLRIKVPPLDVKMIGTEWKRHVVIEEKNERERTRSSSPDASAISH